MRPKLEACLHALEAGVGNAVNCGAAMYMAPVGLVNAADPRAAYAEALDVAGAHQSSYGREAAGGFAAAVAAACAPDASHASVGDACLRLARDGTRAAIEAVCEVAVRHQDFESALRPLREAVAPFDTVGPDYRAPSLGARRPSRLHSIEELPIALGMLLVGAGDYRRTVLGSVNYGRDCDSIATMGGAIAGALASCLATMVANLSIGKKKYAAHEETLRGAKRDAERLREELLGLARRDAEAFDGVLRAGRLPEGNAEQAAERDRALAAAGLQAARVPLETAATCLRVLEVATRVAKCGNANAVSDAGTAGWLARAGGEGALLNVEINLKSLPDSADKQGVETELHRLHSAFAPASEACSHAVRAVLGAP